VSTVRERDPQAILHRADQPLDLGRSTMTVLATAASTGGVYSLYRFDLQPAAGGPRPHYHRLFAESFAVLEGDVELYDGHRWVPAGAGDHLFIPAGVAHGFRHTADAPASLVMLSAPGAPREDYFAELAEIISGRRTLTGEDWRELYARHDQYPA
jgi:mannose-6-phosphate isomerase-like protein (cupin superfamily)